jgi:hypothetical protein
MLCGMKRIVVVIVCLIAAGAVGCGESALETGYEPRKIGASVAQRRAYYASPYTPQAQAAQQERDQDLESRRPHPGY